MILHRSIFRPRVFVIALLLAFWLPVAPAGAAVFSVGPGANCTHATLQAGLDAAANKPGPDVVRIVRTATWTAIQVSTQTDQDVEIIGGYSACDSAAPTGKTTLSGADGNARSVIALRGNGLFKLRNLVIRDGDQAGDDDGGGIHFIGGGIVEISDSEIIENEAEDGGGIYAEGTSALAELVIGANVTVGFNIARRHGGGVVAQNLEMTMTAPGSILFMNTAGDRGGGLIVASGTFASYAYIGSNGIGDLGAIYGNHAAKGGGIAVLAGEESSRDAIAMVFSTQSGVPARIRGNSATQSGGGIDLQPDRDLSSLTRSPAIARLTNVAIEENTAPVGAAIHLGNDDAGPFGEIAYGGEVIFNQFPFPHPAAAGCPFGAPCGYIRNNDTGNLTGAIVHLTDGAGFTGSRIAIDGNEGGWLMYLAGEEFTSLTLDNSLIVGNTVQNALVRDDQNEDSSWPLVEFHYLTVTGNTIGANGVLSINEDMTFTRSLVDQPDKALYATDAGATGGVHDVQYVVENGTDNPPGTTPAPPRFVDAANGDYMPRAGSRAVDYAPALPGFGADLYSHTRTIDLSIRPNTLGASDLGALEREYVQPLVLNGDFDTSLNLWNGGDADSFWDSTQNATGPAGSGSVRVLYDTDPKGAPGGPRLAGRSQCIHLPGPGVYALNGWGRVVPASNPPLVSNHARLTWELRYDGGLQSCENGAPSLAGTHQLATGSTWTRPGSPALIEVPLSVWTTNTSLTVRLDVIGNVVNPPTAWFDGITLETGVDDTIFADGFE